MTDEEGVFCRKIRMSKVILLRDSKTPDANFRPDFVSVLEKNACDDKCNKKIRDTKENKGIYPSTYLVFHIGKKEIIWI
ncbi:hypothetical protein [Ferroplasma sp. Type II]|uniref:hypothetical protein n=1 Tax=Ferroplasma sp. Type II TaxID=261388 RepID=UPI001808F827|nr:hypothetical protein [Ferroplasma sp. Type II]HII82440.1 hypothetical protein [Ferroplasma sp.]